MTKEQLNSSFDGQSLDATLAAEDGRQIVCLNDPECREYTANAARKFQPKNKTKAKTEVVVEEKSKL